MKDKPKYSNYGWTQWGWLVRHRKNFKLGKNTQIGAGTIIDAMEGVVIEDNVKIGFGVKILSYSKIGDKKGKVILKKGCSIGSNCVIEPNNTIGSNSIIGCNSYINRNVPENEFWFGNPAKKYNKDKTIKEGK